LTPSASQHPLACSNYTERRKTQNERRSQIKCQKKNVAIFTFFVPKVGDEKEVAKLGMEDSPVLGRQLVCSFC
jgi:hypothetical protein